MNRLKLEGLTELRAALRSLPADLAREAGGIVLAAADSAKAEIVAAYPEVTGNLKRGVTVTKDQSPLAAGAILRSRAKHSHLYEYGTQIRRDAKGSNRGAMPARPTFVPVVVRKRRGMVTSLVALLQSHGITVTGDAG